jgi:hypothetical protein
MRALGTNAALIGVALLSAPLSGNATAAEGCGQLRAYRGDGRLLNAGKRGQDTIQSYLVSERACSGEDGFYVDGVVQERVNYASGGFEFRRKNFAIVCSHADGERSVRVSADQDPQKAAPISIEPTQKRPGARSTLAQHLFWAACNKHLKRR